MEKLELAPQQEYKGMPINIVGIYSKNREEWVITDIACWTMSITNVPLYDTLGEPSICWIFEQTQINTVFLNSEGVPKLIAIAKKGKIPMLRTMVCFDKFTPEQAASAEEAKIKLINFADVIGAGSAEPGIPFKPCKGESIITICYTSGTTGQAKGAVITHKNFRDNAVVSLHSNIFVGYKVGYGFLSYLPLAHVFERVVLYISIIGCLKIAFFHGSLNELKDDILASKPDAIIGVPRVFGRFYDTVMSSIEALGSFKRKLLDMALNTKVENYKKNGALTHAVYDKIIFSKIRNAFGGNIKTFVSAAAPMDSHIMEMLKLMCSCKFLQGYGQTETAGPISIS